MHICLYVYMHMLSYSIYAHTWGFRVWGIMYIHMLCMHTHVYCTLVYVQIYIYIQNIHTQGWHVYLYTHIYTYNCVMLSGLFPLGFAFWEFRVYILKVCVRVCVYTCVWGCEVCVCVCVCVCVDTWVCAALYVANMWEYMYTSWYHGFSCFPFSVLLSQSLGFVSWVHVCMYVYISLLLFVCMYVHISLLLFVILQTIRICCTFFIKT
jgi:hypothetical protein